MDMFDQEPEKAKSKISIEDISGMKQEDFQKRFEEEKFTIDDIDGLNDRTVSGSDFMKATMASYTQGQRDMLNQFKYQTEKNIGILNPTQQGIVRGLQKFLDEIFNATVDRVRETGADPDMYLR